MVKTVNDGEVSNNAIKQKPLFIVELVGPAGAGKTTLSRVLSQRNEKILIGADIELRKLEHIPIFVGNIPFLLPIFLQRCQPSRWFTWDELKSMVYLREWTRVLMQQAANNGTTILLDHGPVFKLATLNAFGPERLKSQDFETWWSNMFTQWALTLDMIVWLDASDSILIERINTRDQHHAIKGKTELEAYSFLARYRKSYEQILDKLTAHGEPSLLQFDTNQASFEQIADEILVAWGFKLSENGA